ncbi:MAG: N-acetylmuramoyl-L-alanine amidase [Chlorobiaceae bacterium]|nr:N-acetylmuramoyl-L-alanine amidase [Chlorobiaceae bacterium]
MPDVIRHSIYRIALVLLVTVLQLFSLSLFAASPPLTYGPTTVPVQVNMGVDQRYTIKILAMRSGNTLMVDIGSMARALRMSFHSEGGIYDIEESLDSPGSRCRVEPGNHFASVVSKDPEGRQRIIQLNVAPLRIESRSYLPVTQACRLFTVWLDREIVYSYSSGRITAWLKGKRFAESVASIGVVKSDDQNDLTRKTASAEEAKTVITGIEVENRANGAIITFAATGAPTQASLLKPDAEGTAYFSLQNGQCDGDALSKIYGSGVVRVITPKQFEGGGLQFAITLDNKAFIINSVEFQRDAKKNRYQLYIRSKADVQEIRKREKEEQIARVINRDVEKWKLNTVVLDAGHGGKDPGAIGGNGTREKDVVLNIVHDLGNFIEQNWPDVNVIYTRKDDTFIPLHERGKIANRAGGKLFISVHCNASPNRSARGSEVYILGLHKTQAALDVALFENSVIRKEDDYQLQYKGFSEEHLIMSSMAQNAFARQSTSLAQDILKPVEKIPGNNGRGVRQAGFMVLWTPSMPSALVEVGYLSNYDEERVLRDRQEQAKIAYGIFKGLESYRKNYETTTMASMGK